MNNLNDLFNWYEKLSRESLDDIKKFYADNVFFKDPFNEITGREKVRHIFVEMFEQLEEPRFKFIDKIEQDGQIFVTWDFHFSVKKKKMTIHGSSHLKLDEQKKIVYHRDYWDVGEELLLKIPLVKSIYGVVRRKFGSA